MKTLVSCNIQYFIQTQYHQLFYFIPHENTRKTEVFRRYQMGTLTRNELRETQQFLKILVSSKWCNQEIGILTTTNLVIT